MHYIEADLENWIDEAREDGALEAYLDRHRRFEDFYAARERERDS